MQRLSRLLNHLPYVFLVFAGGLCLATFLTSATLAAPAAAGVQTFMN